MKNLDDAWVWYQAVKVGMRRLTHLSKYWDEFPWDDEVEWLSPLARDNVLKSITASKMAEDADCVRNQLDDLAVFVLFSVFEAVIRDLVYQKVRPEVEQIRHPALKSAGQSFLEGLSEGSFFHILEPFKSPTTHDVIEKVNKVRKYRNWVAHGRHGEEPTDNVRTEDAYDWLRRFIDHVHGPELTALSTFPENESE